MGSEHVPSKSIKVCAEVSKRIEMMTTFSIVLPEGSDGAVLIDAIEKLYTDGRSPIPLLAEWGLGCSATVESDSDLRKVVYDLVAEEFQFPTQFTETTI